MRAADQLEAKMAQIEVDHPRAAAAWVKHMIAAVDDLGRFPLRGRSVGGTLDGPVRELIVAPYRVFYRPEDNRVTILSVKHSREEILPEDLRPDYP